MTEEKGLPLTWGDIHIRLIKGNVSVDSIAFHLNIPDATGKDSAYLHVDISKIYAGRIHWLRLIRHRVLVIDKIEITEPAIEARSIKEAIEALPRHNSDTAKKAIPIDRIEIRKVKVRNGHAALSKRTDKFRFSTDSLFLGLKHISYTFADSATSFCDSVYHFQTEALDYTSADGLFRVTAASIKTKDAGEVVIADIRGGNTDKKEQHSAKVGKVAATWAQFELQEVRTSPVNIFRLIKAREANLETLDIAGRSATIYRDNQYPPAKQFPMPQEALAKMKIPLNIARTNISVDNISFWMTRNGTDAGSLELSNSTVQINDLSNKPGAIFRTTLGSTLADGGQVSSKLEMKTDKECTFTYKCDVRDTHAGCFETFIHPMLGISAGGNLHALEMDLTGNKTNAHGNFCLQYDSLSIHVDSNTPISKLSKFAGVVNTFAPAVLLHRNPRRAGQAPIAVEVECKRDPWKPFPVYLFSPINDGLMQTVLPPTISKSIAKKQKQK